MKALGVSLLLVLQLLVFAMPAQAQFFAREYPVEDLSSEFDAVLPHEGGEFYVAVGYLQYIDRTVIALMRGDGYVVWYRTIEEIRFIARDIAEASDGWVVVGDYVDDAGNAQAAVLKFNFNGFPIWSSLYPSPQGVAYAVAVDTDIDDNAIVIGRFWWYDLKADSDLWAMKIDTNGNVVWYMTYDHRIGFTSPEWSEAGTSLDIAYDGELFYVSANYIRTVAGANTWDVWLLEILSDGMVNRHRDMLTEPCRLNEYIHSIKFIDDGTGDVVVAGTCDGLNPATCSGFFDEDDICVVRLNLDTAIPVSWWYRYATYDHWGSGDPHDDWGYSVTVDGGSNILVAGGSGLPGTGDDLGTILNLRPGNGWVHWFKHYESAGSRPDIFYDIEYLSGTDEFVTVGSNTSAAGQLSSWMMYLDPDGLVGGHDCVALPTETSRMEHPFDFHFDNVKEEFPEYEMQDLGFEMLDHEVPAPCLCPPWCP